jgi:hypothetical protein
VTDDYTPASWGSGVIADSGDHESDAGDHFKSWNRWQGQGGHEPPAEARPIEATITEPAEAPRREQADSSPSQHEGASGATGGGDDGYVPMRRSTNSKRRSRRRGGGRHSLNERKRSKSLVPRRTRRKSEDGEPRHEVAPEPRQTPEPRPEPRPQVVSMPQPETQVAPYQRHEAGLARTEAVAELRTLTAPETGAETDGQRWRWALHMAAEVAPAAMKKKPEPKSEQESEPREPKRQAGPKPGRPGACVRVGEASASREQQAYTKF